MIQLTRLVKRSRIHFAVEGGSDCWLRTWGARKRRWKRSQLDWSLEFRLEWWLEFFWRFLLYSALDTIGSGCRLVIAVQGGQLMFLFEQTELMLVVFYQTQQWLQNHPWSPARMVYPHGLTDLRKAAWSHLGCLNILSSTLSYAIHLCHLLCMRFCHIAMLYKPCISIHLNQIFDIKRKNDPYLRFSLLDNLRFRYVLTFYCYSQIFFPSLPSIHWYCIRALREFYWPRKKKNVIVIW